MSHLENLNKSEAASDKTKRERLETEEYRQDKGELDSETLKERLKHHQDAVKNLEKEIKSLQKDKKEDVKDVKSESDAASDKQKAAREKFLKMIHKKGGDKKDSDKKSDDKKSSEKDESKAKSKAEWDKIDTKELKRDTKKEKKEHEKDAVKDDQSKIKKLEKGKPSEKKRAEVFYLKKDEKFDKARAVDSVTMQVRENNVLEVDIEEAAQKFFGGKKRSNLKDSDFLFPAKRSFPIATPADVPDAVSNFGRMSGNMSYDEFKRKLVSFVKKKGEKFVAALPNTIKKEFDLVDATQIAVFPDKYVDPKDVGTVFQDTRPINYEGYKIDDKLQEQVKKDKLKNPQLRSAQQRAEGLR